VQAEISQLEPEVQANSNDFQKALTLAYRYAQLRQNDKAYQILDSMVNNPHADGSAVFAAAQMYADVFKDVPKIEVCMEKLVKLLPEQPEAWYNLAATKAALGKSTEALQALKRSLELNSKRLTHGTNQLDLRSELDKDPRFESLRSLPEYKALVPPR
jgi:tetratricopeptide (TPR) repeat protein